MVDAFWATVYWELIVPAWAEWCSLDGPAAESACRLEGLTIQDWARIFLQGLWRWPGWPW